MPRVEEHVIIGPGRNWPTTIRWQYWAALLWPDDKPRTREYRLRRTLDTVGVPLIPISVGIGVDLNEALTALDNYVRTNSGAARPAYALARTSAQFLVRLCPHCCIVGPTTAPTAPAEPNES